MISPSPVRLLDTRGLNGPLAGGEAVRVLVPGGTASSVRSHAIVDLLGVLDPAATGSVISQKPARAFDSRARKLRLTASSSLRIPLPATGTEGVSVVS